MDFELLLEAERRGILPSDKAALLAEARRRGLVPGGETPEQRRARIQAGVRANSEAQGGMEGALARAEPLNALAERGGVPADMVFNPNTGQYTSRELLANAYWPEGHEMGGLEAFSVGGLQGSWFGTSDEALGGLYATFPGEGSLGERYAFGREMARAQLDAARDQRPVAAYGGEIVGAVSTPAAAIGALRGAPILARMGAGAATGGAQGALYGFGAGEGGFQDRLDSSGRGAAVGALAGGLLPPAISAVAKGGRAAWNALSTATGRANSLVSSGAVANAMRKAGMSPDDVANALRNAADEGQPEFKIADALGPSGQGLLGSAYRTGDRARQFLLDALTERQDAQGRRVSGFIKEALGAEDTAAGTRNILETARREIASPMYEAVEDAAAPVNLNGALSTIDDLLGRNPIIGDSSLAKSEIGRRLTSIRERMANEGEQLVDFGSVHNLRSDIRQMIDMNPALTRYFKPVRDAIDDALETASEGYKAARDQYRASSRIIEALDEGKASARQGVRAEDVTRRVGEMLPDEVAAFRSGYADPVLAKIENAALGVNRVRTLRGDGFTDVMAEIADDPQLLARRLLRENIMFETTRKATKGSESAERIVDDAKAIAPGLLSSLFSGNSGSALRGAAGEVGERLIGRNEATRDEIVRLLMSQDIERALAPAMSAAERSRVVRAILAGAGTRGAIAAGVELTAPWLPR